MKDATKKSYSKKNTLDMPNNTDWIAEFDKAYDFWDLWLNIATVSMAESFDAYVEKAGGMKSEIILEAYYFARDFDVIDERILAEAFSRAYSEWDL